MNKCAVIVSRNDNYGDNLIHRANLCLNQLSTIFDHIIYVDWKSKNIPLTKEIYNLPSNITTITITKDQILEKRPHWINYPIVEYFAKNIGIRKAINENYDWICSTNIDIMIDNFDINVLDRNTLYTARRRNVPQNLHLQTQNYKDLWNFIKNNKNQYELAPIASKDGISCWDPGDKWSLTVCCGDFQLAHKELWAEIKGFEEEMIGRCYGDSNLMKRPILIGKKTAILNVDLFHLNHGNNSYRDSNEFLPMNNQQQYVANWIKSTNNDNWGQL